MNEEIINGVDVSGCCLYKDGICLTDKGKCTSMCDYGAYAREEELKKLKEENAKLKKKLVRIERILENNLDLFDVYRWDLGTYLLEIIRGEE